MSDEDVKAIGIQSLGTPLTEDHSAETDLRETVGESAKELEAFQDHSVRSSHA
jgi:hypothetical protein